jgi:hypothetical protein
MEIVDGKQYIDSVKELIIEYTKLSNLCPSTDSMKYLDRFLQDEDTSFEGSYHVLA